MTDDLARLVRGTQGQPPSPEFRARLRARVVAETEARRASAGPVSGDETIADGPDLEIDLPPEHEPAGDTAIVVGLESVHEDELAARRTRRSRRSRRFGLLAVAAVNVVLAGIGIWALISQDDEFVRDNVSNETPEAGVAVGELLTAGNTAIDAGTFRIDTLGTAFTFEVDETAAVLRNENGVVSLTDLTSRNADDRTITFRRTDLLPNPATTTAQVDPNTGWPATDLRGWLANLGDDAVAGDPTATTLGGLKATFAEVDFPCGGDCTAGDPLAEPNLPMFTPGSRYQLWVVDQDGQDPIVVIVAIDDDSDVAWLDEAGAILSSLEFESIEPNPVRRLPAGATDLDVFDGIRLELTQDVVVVEPYDGFARVFPPDIGGDVEFLTRPLDSDGAEVKSIEQLVRLLSAEAVELTELEPPNIGGLQTRAFEVASGPFPNIILKTRAAELVRSEFGWESPQGGHLWVIEHPDRGLLIVSAEALTGPDQAEPLRSWTEELLRSLDFRDR